MRHVERPGSGLCPCSIQQNQWLANMPNREEVLRLAGLVEIGEKLDDFSMVSQVELCIGFRKSYLDRIGLIWNRLEEVFVSPIVTHSQHEVEVRLCEKQLRGHTFVYSNVSHLY